MAANGTAWSQLGSGLNGTCNALKIYDGALYAGGEFTIAGAKLPKGQIAKSEKQRGSTHGRRCAFARAGSVVLSQIDPGPQRVRFHRP